MKLSDIYTSNSNFLKAEDLQGKKPVVTISAAEVVEKDYGDGNGAKKQIVLSFEETEKVLGLNVTNATRIAELTDTEDFDEWVGTAIKLYVEQVTFQDRKVPAIRIFPELPEVKTKAKADDDDGSGIPF